MSRGDFRSAFRHECARRHGSRVERRRSQVTAEEPGTGWPARRQNLAVASSPCSPWGALVCAPFVKPDTTRDQAEGLTKLAGPALRPSKGVAARRRPPGTATKEAAPPEAVPARARFALDLAGLHLHQFRAPNGWTRSFQASRLARVDLPSPSEDNSELLFAQALT